MNLDSRVDGQTVRGVARAFRDKRGDINQPSGHFSSKFDMGSYLLYSFAFFDKEFKKASGKYEKQRQPIRIKVGTWAIVRIKPNLERYIIKATPKKTKMENKKKVTKLKIKIQ